MDGKNENECDCECDCECKGLGPVSNETVSLYYSGTDFNWF